eukprot:COSAG01_NODE_2874_length_6937_cov_4.473823_3_plen_113_part_00
MWHLFFGQEILRHNGRCQARAGALPECASVALRRRCAFHRRIRCVRAAGLVWHAVARATHSPLSINPRLGRVTARVFVWDESDRIGAHFVFCRREVAGIGRQWGGAWSISRL